MSPATSFPVSGIAYQTNGTTALANVSVNVTNETTGESHSSSDSGFENLLTNSAGEWQTNLADFTDGYNNGDIISSSTVDSSGNKDTETFTVVTANGSQTGINLVVVPDATNLLNEGINSTGEEVTYSSMAETYEDDRGNIETETATTSTITIYHEITEDEVKLVEWGEIQVGEALGIFKGKDDPVKGDKILLDSREWRVQNKPRLYKLSGVKHHWEARMVLIDG